MPWQERLGALDAAFLYLEGRTAHMHVGALCLFEGPPPTHAELTRHVEARLPSVPRYRQRLAPVPFALSRPVWVDDAKFDLEYHLRRTALPAPGGDAELKRLTSRLFAQRLDRDKPLWELWCVEGLEEGRFALVSKTHHCMVDGISGVDIATVLLDPSRKVPPSAPPEPWRAREAPSTVSLMTDGLAYQLTHPLEVARQALAGGAEARRALGEIALGALPILKLLGMGLAPESSLNRPIGPHRRFETARLPLDRVRRVKTAFEATVNDVVLAVVTGALRALLLERGDRLTADLRALVPVSVRSPDARHTLGNQVTAVFCPLPVGEADPRRRLEQVRTSMEGLKATRQAVGGLALTQLGDFAPPTLAAQAARLQPFARFFNLVVTNVPGPQHPLFLLGRRMRECYPAVPLAANQTLCIGLLSYDGTIGVGLLGDADQARDLRTLAAALTVALDELEATLTPPRGARKREGVRRARRRA